MLSLSLFANGGGGGGCGCGCGGTVGIGHCLHEHANRAAHLLAVCFAPTKHKSTLNNGGCGIVVADAVDVGSTKEKVCAQLSHHPLFSVRYTAYPCISHNVALHGQKHGRLLHQKPPKQKQNNAAACGRILVVVSLSLGG
jgi:hypothetical protein